MTLKNGAKEYFTMWIFTTVGYGAIMTLINLLLDFGDTEEVIRNGIIIGILFGLLFTGVMILISVMMEKKYASLCQQMYAQRRLICNGAANYNNSLNAVGGWLFYSRGLIEFRAHPINFGPKDITIPVAEVTSVTATGRKLIITTQRGNFSFVVVKAPVWRDFIIQNG